VLKLSILAVALAVLGSRVAAHTVDLGIVSVPNACSRTGPVGQNPFGQSQRIETYPGSSQVQVLLLPERELPNDEPDTRMKRCTAKAYDSMRNIASVPSDGRLEELLKSRINACLVESGSDNIIRFVNIRRGPIECPNSLSPPRYCKTDAGVLGPYPNDGSVKVGDACYGTKGGQRFEGVAVTNNNVSPPRYCKTDAGVLGPYPNDGSVKVGDACYGTKGGQRFEGVAVTNNNGD
jgi:hypothetical protein